MAAMIALLHPGGPLQPHDLWRAWNTDPFIWASLLLAAACYASGVRRLWQRRTGAGIGRWRVCCFVLGIAALSIALASPLDALADTLFSAHMVQHLLLIVAAPPLLVAGNAGLAWLWSMPQHMRRAWSRAWNDRSRLRRISRPLRHPLTAWLLQALALTAWHVPALYDAAVGNEAVHVMQHASYLGTASLFWGAVLRPEPRLRPAFGAGLIGIFAAAMQGGALGALLTFGQQPWYVSHHSTTTAWSLSPLQDQQIAGAIMWVPGGLAYLFALGVLMMLWLRAAERRVRAAEAAHREPHAGAAHRDLGLELS